MNLQLELVNLQKMIEDDLGVIFDRPFNRKGRALVWKKHPVLGRFTHCVLGSDGMVIYQSDGMMNDLETATWLEGENLQTTWIYREQIRANLSVRKIGAFYGGFAIVTRHSETKKYNFCDRSGNLLSQEWFDECENFSQGRACCKSGNAWNYILENGEFLFKNPVMMARSFADGVGVIQEGNELWYFTDLSGKKLSDGYSWIHAFSENKALVILKGRTNWISRDMSPLFSEWQSNLRSFDSFYCGRSVARLKSSPGYNYFLENGQWLWHTDLKTKPADKYLIRADPFVGGYARIEDKLARNSNKSKVNFLSPDGEFLSRRWFLEGELFRDGFALVLTANGYNYLDYKGDLLLEESFPIAHSFSCGYALVGESPQGPWYFIDRKGKKVEEDGFSKARSFCGGRALVSRKSGSSEAWNYLTMDQDFLLDEWFFSNSESEFISPYVSIYPQRGRNYVLNWFGERIMK